MRLQSSDSTTSAALAAATSRQGWCEALSAALGSGYRVVWRDAGGDARVTLTMTGAPAVIDQRLSVSSPPAEVVCSAGTPVSTYLESADGTRWARLDRMMPLVDGHRAPLPPVAGAGFTWIDPLTVLPPQTLSPLPAWLQGAPLLTWVELPGTKMIDVMPVVTGKEAGITAYSGGALVGTDLFVNGGGHTDYNGNEWLRLRLGLDTPAWDIPVPASAAADRTQNAPYYLDGKPCSRHTYDAIAWVPQHNRLFLLGGVPPFSSGSPPASLHVDGLNLSTFAWDLPNAGAIWPDMPHYSSGMPVAQSPDHLWIWTNANLYRCDTTTMQWTNCGAVGGSTKPDRGALYDPQRNRLFRTGQVYGTGGPQYMSLDGYSGGMPTATNVEFNTAAAPGFSPDCSVIYCPDLGGSDCYLAHVRGDDDMTVFRIDPDTFVVTVVPMDGAKPPIPATGYGAGDGIYGRFAYVPQLKGCVWAHSSTRNVFFFRTA